MNQKLAKKKKKTIIYLISGVLIIASLGTIAYLAWPKKTTETETKTTEEKISQLQSQLSQIKNALTTLNNNITQTESSLQQKCTQQTQTPQDSLQTQINQLETQLTTYKNQKSKLEIIIPKLEQQIGNLNKGENNSNQEKIIDEIEKEIKEVNEELEKNEKKDDKPKEDKPKKDDSGKDDEPKKNPKPKPEDDKKPEKEPDKKESPNLAEFQSLRENTKKLITKLEKMIEWMKKHLTGKLRLSTFSSQITFYLDIIKKNKRLLENYSSDKDHDIFVKSGPETQKLNLSLFQDTVKGTLKSVKECFDQSLFCKIPADFGFGEVSEEELTNNIYPFVKNSQIQLNGTIGECCTKKMRKILPLLSKT